MKKRVIAKMMAIVIAMTMIFGASISVYAEEGSCVHPEESREKPYERISDTEHKFYCSSCNTYITEGHENTYYVSHDGATHVKMCDDCHGEAGSPEAFTSNGNYTFDTSWVSGGHLTTCVICGQPVHLGCVASRSVLDAEYHDSHCALCGHVYKDREQHNFNASGICTYCGYNKAGHSTTTEEKTEEKPSEPTETVEPTAETISNPASAATYTQATKSVIANVQEFAKQVASGKVSADKPAQVNLGHYHSVSRSTMEEIEKANVDVEMTYRYMGHIYTVKIPKGYKFDKGVTWYGPLYMYLLFGQSIK